MWLLERLVPDASPNNLSLAFQADGALDASALRGALTVLVDRHEVLRTVYLATGADLMKTVLPPERFTADVEEITGLTADEDGLERGLRPFVNRRFPLDGRPLLRAALFRRPAGDVFCVAFHHLVYDIISATRILEELVAAYNHLVAGEPVPPELLVPVAPYTEPEPKPESLEYWRTQLAGFDPAGPALWCGTPDAGEPTLAGDQITRVLSDTARATVRRLQGELRAPEAVVLLTAYYVLLAAHGAGPDITVGSPVSVRPREDPRAVGHHTNVLPLRLFTDPAESFRTLVLRARDAFFGGLGHADVPVDSIPDLVPRAGSSWRNRLYRHLFNYFPGLGLPDFELGGVPARPVLVENGFNKFDLEFFVASATDTLRVIARYCTDHLSRDDAEALLLRYEALLETLPEVLDVPTGELRVWSGHDRKVIDAANDTDAEVRPATVLAAVHALVVAAPDAVAVHYQDRTVTYRGLWAGAVAARDALTAGGVGPGDIVAIAAARTPELIATALGTWLAGAAYLPVDPEHPAQRVHHLLTDSGAKVLVTDRDLDTAAGPDLPRLPLSPIPEHPSDVPPGEFHPPVAPSDPAYLIYTSGTSGKPKGALITHRSIANIAADYEDRLHTTAADATLWMTTFAFDMANLELYTPLWSGGRIVIAPDEARVDGQVLLDTVLRYRPDIIQATPTTWRLVLDRVAPHLAGRRVVTGGETVPVELIRRLLDAGSEVHHAYGPTETVTWCTWSVLTDPARLPDERLDIGIPIRNTRVMVTAPDGRELPVGVRGELRVAGAGVALGYHNRPELTGERFGTHPVHGRYYRTGDLGRWRADGTLELFGRADRQVKLRGNRIELGEVEAILLGHPLVRAVAVVVVGDRSADAHLVAFVESTGEGDVSDDLWAYARTELPRAALPQEFVVLDALPVSANEKVDYVALEVLAAADRTGAADSARAAGAAVAADGTVEELVGLWRELLDRDDIDPETNFFTHGGHSLLGAQLLQRLENATGVTLKLADLFAAPTPAALAERMSGPAALRATAS